MPSSASACFSFISSVGTFVIFLNLPNTFVKLDNTFLFFYNIDQLCVCGYATTNIWRWEDNLPKSVLSGNIRNLKEPFQIPKCETKGSCLCAGFILVLPNPTQDYYVGFIK